MAEETQYDVFLSHNSQDKPAVEILARRLADEAGLRPFLDKWHLVPGEPWQEALEEALDRSRTCAVFIGPRGISPWEHEEMRAAIEQRVADRAFRVIPVLLPGAERGKRGRLPAFLTRATWVEFRETLDDADAFRRLVAGIKGIAPGRGLGEVVYEGVCPYRGLQVFEEEHAPFFFGREAATEWLVDDLRGSRFLAVIGPSGSGKSSLVRAGLVPALRRGDLPGSETWPLCIFRPGHRPLESLAVALIQLTGPSDDPMAPLQLMDALAADQRQLHLTTRLALAEAPADRTIALVVDQFEEIFTLCRDEGQQGPLIENLLYASAIEGGRTVVVLTMRADFYGKCAAYPDLAARITDHQMLVSPMVEEELRQAIERPAQLVGLEFEGGLVEALLRDVQAEPGALPLLQHTLLELWERRERHCLTFAAYREIGGVQGTIAHRAESIYAGFDAVRQAITRRIMLRLVAPGEGTEDTRRRARRSELLPTGELAEATEAVLQTLADARLVTTSRDMATGEEQVDVSHEALIRGWPRMREWIDEDRAGLLTHRRLTEAAVGWERHDRDESYLHRGARLAEAEEWAETRASDLNELERAFLVASLAQREQEVQEREEQRRKEEQLAAERRTARRLRWLRNSLLAAISVTVGLAVVAYGQRNNAMRQKAIAEHRTDEVKSLILVDRGRQALNEGSTDLAIALALQANNMDQPPVPAQALLAEAVYASKTIRRFSGHTDSVGCVAFSPDGHTALSGSDDKTLRLWDIESGEEIRRFSGHTNSVYSVIFSPNGRTALSGSVDHTLRLWDVETGKEIRRFNGHTGEVISVAFNPDGRTALSGAADASLRLWDVESGKEIRSLTGHAETVLSVAFSPDGSTALSGSMDRTLRLWDVETGKEIRRFNGHTSAVRSVAFSPDGSTALSGSLDESLRLWNVKSGEEIRHFDSSVGEVLDVAFNPDGRTALSSHSDGTLILWDIERGEEIQHFKGHTGAVWRLAFSLDGRTALSASVDKSARLWDVANSKAIHHFNGHAAAVSSLTFNPNGPIALSASYDHDLILWDVEGGKEIHRFKGHAAVVNSVAISPDGLEALSGGGDNDHFLILWDVESGQEIRRFYGHTNWVTSVAFGPDGSTALSGSHDHSLILWDVKTGEKIRQFEGHTGWVLSVAFSPDGLTALSGSADNTLVLWDVKGGKKIRQFEGHTGWVSSVAFSPDGLTALSGSADRTMILWDINSGKEIRRFEEYGEIWSVAFSPYRYAALSGSRYGRFTLWNLESGTAIKRFAFRYHRGDIGSVAFSPDGRTALLGLPDGSMSLWPILPVASDQLTVWVKANRYVRELTCEERDPYRLEPCNE